MNKTKNNAPNNASKESPLREARKKLRLTQKDIAVKLGVSQACVAAWENRKVNVRAARELERIYGIRADWLLNREGEMFTDWAQFPESQEGNMNLLKAIVSVLTSDGLFELKQIVDNRFYEFD